jgi:hypothetical protein
MVVAGDPGFHTVRMSFLKEKESKHLHITIVQIKHIYVINRDGTIAKNGLWP